MHVSFSCKIKKMYVKCIYGMYLYEYGQIIFKNLIFFKCTKNNFE